MSKSIFAPILRESNTEELENLIQKGSDKISEFKHILKEFAIQRIFESTVNGKRYNSRLELTVSELAFIVNGLQNKLNSPNNLDVEELKSFIRMAKLDRNVAIEALIGIHKSAKCDDEDKEKAHKVTAQYDQLVTEYNNLLYKLSLKNIKLRSENVNDELMLEFLKAE